MNQNTTTNEDPNAAAADPASAAAAGSDPANGAAAPAAGSAFAAAAAAAPAADADPNATAAQAPLPISERIPEKYQVKKDDGSIDVEASTAKLLDGHAELQKRFGAGDTPVPKTPEEYAPTVPDGFNLEDLKADPKYQTFLKGCHAKGINNEQLSFVLEQYAERAPDEQPAMPLAEFEQSMKQVWSKPGEYEENMGYGLRALRSVVPGITAEELAAIPNNPTVAKVLAAYGREIQEDRAAPVTAITAADFDTQLAALQADPAYMDANHPQHAAVLAKQTELFAKRYPQPQ